MNKAQEIVIFVLEACAKIEAALAAEDMNEAAVWAQKINDVVLQDHAPETEKNVLADSRVATILPMLRRHLSFIEYMQEKAWNEKICHDGDTLRHFPDFKQYQALIESELAAISALLSSSRNSVCFIGSGPLPLSALALERHEKVVSVKAIDWLGEAIALGKTFALTQQSNIIFECIDPVHIDYAAYDVIFIASLVQEKQTILEHVRKTAKAGAVVIVRTAEGLRTLVYEPVDEEAVPCGMALFFKTGIIAHSVNSTLFYQIKS